MPARDSTIAESILAGKQAACDARRARREAHRASQEGDDLADEPLPGDNFQDEWDDAVEHLMSQDSPRTPSSASKMLDKPVVHSRSPSRSPTQGHRVSFSHIALRPKHAEVVLAAARSHGLTDAHIGEVEITLTEMMSSRGDPKLTVQDLLDALADYLEFDYSCASLLTKPKTLPKIVGLAPHIQDIMDFLGDDDLMPPSDAQDDDEDDNTSSGDARNLFASPLPATRFGFEELRQPKHSREHVSREHASREHALHEDESSEDESSEDAKSRDDVSHEDESSEDAESGEDTESGEDAESGEDGDNGSKDE